MLNCKFCTRECKNKNSLSNHELRCKQNPERKIFPLSSSVFKPGRTSWSKGLTKETNSSVRLQSEKTRGVSKQGHSHTEQTRQKLSVIAKERGLGGYQKGSGRGRSGWYRGYYCDSSYELAWIIYNLDHNIQFKRNTTKFPYSYNGKELKWIPDFIDSDNNYVEIKGYMTEQVKAKIKDFPHPLQILMEKDLQNIFEYVINKYGKNFTELYE